MSSGPTALSCDFEMACWSSSRENGLLYVQPAKVGTSVSGKVCCCSQWIAFVDSEETGGEGLLEDAVSARPVPCHDLPQSPRTDVLKLHRCCWSWPWHSWSSASTGNHLHPLRCLHQSAAPARSLLSAYLSPHVGEYWQFSGRHRAPRSRRKAEKASLDFASKNGMYREIKAELKWEPDYGHCDEE